MYQQPAGFQPGQPPMGGPPNPWGQYAAYGAGGGYPGYGTSPAVCVFSYIFVYVFSILLFHSSNNNLKHSSNNHQMLKQVNLSFKKANDLIHSLSYLLICINVHFIAQAWAAYYQQLQAYTQQQQQQQQPGGAAATGNPPTVQGQQAATQPGKIMI